MEHSKVKKCHYFRYLHIFCTSKYVGFSTLHFGAQDDEQQVSGLEKLAKSLQRKSLSSSEGFFLARFQRLPQTTTATEIVGTVFEKILKCNLGAVITCLYRTEKKRFEMWVLSDNLLT